MTVPTKEQVENVVMQLKARKYELEEEKKIVDFQLAKYIGMLEILKETNEAVT